MINADAYPPLIVSQVVDAVRDRLAEVRVLKVVNPHFFGFAFGSPFLPAVLEISDQFLLLGVHRDDRLPAPLERFDLLIDELELSVAIGVRATLCLFGLYTVVAY